MTGRILLGMETEYALGVDGARKVWDLRRVADALLTMARSNGRAYLPEEGGGHGVFLANGARLYLDRGHHPEFATPECADPWQVVAYARAGELLLQDLLADAERLTPMAGASVLFRCSVDYSRLGSTWGCHESYLHACDPRFLPDHLLPHLVSRVIYAGAGGFHPLRPGLEFTLSPRAWLLPESVSANSTNARGIFHTKDESLGGRQWHRMHVIGGESLCSDRASVLKLGTTALVLAAVDAGWRPGSAVRLASPVEALREIAADPMCQATARLADGRRLTAIELQRFYLGQIEDWRKRGRLPEWARDLCELWRTTLDALETMDGSRLRGLDWVVKLELYRERTRQRGLDWDALPVWSGVMRRLERTAARLFHERGPQVADLLQDDSPFQKEVDRVTPLVRAGGMGWTDARALFRLRHELLEADLRFGQLGPRGVYNGLQRLGLVGAGAGRPIPEPRPLVDEPPAHGRARVRGNAVREIWSRGEAVNYRAAWTRVIEAGSGRCLDLTDPFCEGAAWIGPAEIAALVARVAEAGT